MLNRFVRTSNVERFLGAVGGLEQRGAPEACILLVAGDAGHGKSMTGLWWAEQHKAVRVRIKAAATPHWILSDLVKELGEQAPARSCEQLFAQAAGTLLRQQRPVVVDEVENGLADLKCLETLRDLGDLTEVPLVFIGREYVWGRLKRHAQFRTRVGARADFTALGLEDVVKLLKELCECDVAADAAKEVHRQSEGYVREIIKAIKHVERAGLRLKGKRVDLEDIKGQTLVHEWQRSGRKEAPAAAQAAQKAA
jgi:hypothetical protein